MIEPLEGAGHGWLLASRLTDPAFQRDAEGFRWRAAECDVLELGWRVADQMVIENHFFWSALDDAVHHEHLLGEQ